MANNVYADAIKCLYDMHDAKEVVMRNICFTVAAQNPSAFVKAYTKVVCHSEEPELVEIPLCGSIKKTDQTEIAKLAYEGRKIQAIKLLRTLTNCSLFDGKNYVDTLPAGI